MRRAWPVAKRTITSFYDDQMTHHAAALTYYALMSLFPALLLGVSLLGLLGQFPETYEAILSYLRDVAPDTTLDTVDAALRHALRSKGTAAGALAVGIVTTLYGTTGALEAARRALNVVFDVENGRGFLRRKATDVVSSVVLMGLVLATLILVFVGGGLAEDLLGFAGLGSTAASVWAVARWPAALAVATLVFALIYYVTPDVEQRGFRWITPGAVAAVAVWIVASVGFSSYLSNLGSLNATYGSFTAAIILIFWLWLTNVALLFGAELNAEIEREKELQEGVPEAETLRLRERG
ncbi:MAG: YihY/virulence factor BrkB family protein [Actinomycetota bacterium]|nr:YihY/virulence factor BrkB family protein [Actinomycetota bacterium]